MGLTKTPLSRPALAQKDASKPNHKNQSNGRVEMRRLNHNELATHHRYTRAGLIFSQEASNTLDPLETVIYIRFFSLLGIASLLIFSKSKIFITKKAVPILLFQGILETTGYFCLVSAYTFDKVSIAVVISSGFGLVTVILARLILKEKISKIQGSGILLTFLGVIGLTI